MAYFWFGFAVVLGAGFYLVAFVLLAALINYIKNEVEWWLG